MPRRPAAPTARQLFAHVLDLPGGMRIGTIHAFCQSLLRRFPLEARLSPHFRLVDEADATEALREAREDVLAEAHDLERRSDLSTLAGLATEQQFGRLVATLRSEPERLARAAALGRAGLLGALNRVLDAEPDDAAVLARATAWAEEAALQQACRVLADLGSAKVAEKAVRLLEWLALAAEHRADAWHIWRGEFLLDDGAPRGAGALFNQNLGKSRPEVVEVILAEQTRIARHRGHRRACRTASVSAALAALAAPVARAYDERKETLGAARLRRPDLPFVPAAGGPRRGLGALQARRRARPSAARRGAGHRARAMGDRRAR